MSGLICFAMTIQILSLCALMITNNAYLIQCARQSIMDLSCLSHAKAIIKHNTLIRECHGNKKELILEYQAFIQDKNVFFEDQFTYILCRYAHKDRLIEMRIYYDRNGLLDVDYIAN